MTLRSPISAATPMCRCGRRIPFRPPRPTGLLAMLLAGIVTGMAVADDPRVELRHIGTIDEPLIREPSGLVRSRQYPGVFWILSDSGNPPFLYAIQRTGKVIARYHIVDAVNLDWEALAADDRGNLFVADVGNNVSLPRRWIYRLREPNPNAPDRNYLRDVKFEDRTEFTFDDDPFDIEAAFFWKNRLLLISKKKNKTRLYEVPRFLAPQRASADPPSLISIGRVKDITTATGAAISGDRLAVCSYNRIALYQLNHQSAFDDAELVVRFKADSVEAICWDGDSLLTLGEDGKLHSWRPPAPLRRIR